MIRRLLAEAALLVLLALACAWAANAVAGPQRHLSWFPKAVRAVPVAPAAPAAAVAPPAAPRATAPSQVPPTARPGPPKLESSSARGPAAPPDPGAELLQRFPPLTDAPLAEISPEDARWLHSRGALFLDARRTSLWAEGHIRGAKVISVWEDGLAEKVEQLAMFTRDLKAPVVVYCAGGDCQDSHLLAQKLWVAGFRNLRIYTGGYPDWETRRGPIAKGDAP